MKLNRFLVQLQRVISWVIVPLMIVMVVTGYVYTGQIRILHRGQAFDLHTTLDLPLILLLVAHVVLGARTELKRFKIRGRIVDVALFMFGVVLALIAVYVDSKVL